jgi:hypothetical protein
MANTIITKNSATATAVPTAGQLVQGELAVNVTDKRLFTENSGGTVVEVGTNPSTIAVAGNATVGGTLGVTGLATLASSTLTANPTLSAGTANGVTYLNGSKVLTSGSALTFDGSALAVTGTLSAGNGISYFNNLDSNIMLRVGVGITSTLGTGEGLEFSFTAPTAKILSYNRATSAYKNIFIDALTQSFGISGSEGMRLTSTGLGIGTSSPANPTGGKGFELSNASGASLRLTNSATYLDFQSGGSANYILSNGAYPLLFYTNGTERLRLDASGNLGLGVTPSAWASAYKVLQIGSASSIFNTSSSTLLVTNGYIDSGFAWRYQNTSHASRYTLESGSHIWYTAPSGTAGGTISFTQAMTLGADGLLQVGTTTGSIGDGKLQVRATGTGSGAANTVVGLNVFEESSGNKAGLWFGAMTNSNVGVIGSRTASGSIAFQTFNGGWGERARITSDGYLRMASGTGGIQFNGDTAAANALDDYEEGTFTVFARDEDNNAQTYYESPGQYNRGHYVKIGQYVYFTIQMYTSGSGSTVGAQAVKITGLPFTAATVGGNGNVGSCTFPYFSDSSGGVGVFVGSVTEGGTSIYIQKTDTNGVTSAATITNWSTPRLSAVGWYRAAA